MPTLTTRLDAVNVILGAAGEQPVNDLSGTTADAANAAAILDEVSREVQSEGWHFNTEDDVPFTPGDGGIIDLPSNVVRIDADASEFDVVQRGTRLYDRGGRTYVFTAPLSAEVIYCLDWDDLPEAARRYIAVRAARVFHDRFIGSELEHRFTADDEVRARAVLEATNLDTGDYNIFRNAQLANALRRY